MKTYALPVSIILLALALTVSAFVYQSQQAVGSVIWGGEYQFKNVTSTTGVASLKTLPGSIGSIVVDSAGSAGQINLYATTSTATTSSELLISFDGAAVEGTYVYDVTFGNGLLLEEKGFNGEAVVTYR